MIISEKGIIGFIVIFIYTKFDYNTIIMRIITIQPKWISFSVLLNYRICISISLVTLP